MASLICDLKKAAASGLRFFCFNPPNAEGLVALFRAGVGVSMVARKSLRGKNSSQIGLKTVKTMQYQR
jgi:hypothetical protein